MKFWRNDERAQSPSRAHPTDSGWDFYGLEQTVIRPGEIVKVRTGIVVGCNFGSGGFIWDKSGRGAAGLKVLGGVIDQTYVGEINVILGNMNLWKVISLLGNVTPTLLEFQQAIAESTIVIEPDKAIAQMVFSELYNVEEMQEISQSEFYDSFQAHYKERGTKGFGSTDLKLTE